MPPTLFNRFSPSLFIMRVLRCLAAMAARLNGWANKREPLLPRKRWPSCGPPRGFTLPASSAVAPTATASIPSAATSAVCQTPSSWRLPLLLRPTMPKTMPGFSMCSGWQINSAMFCESWEQTGGFVRRKESKPFFSIFHLDGFVKSSFMAAVVQVQW